MPCAGASLRATSSTTPRSTAREIGLRDAHHLPNSRKSITLPARNRASKGHVGWLVTPIPFDNRLSPKNPFLLGGEYSLANLRPLPWEKNLECKSEIYRQTKGLPEGANIEIRSQ